MIIEKENINKVIPQQKPFVMIDNLLEFDEKSATTSLVVKEDNLFFENNGFNENGMIENMAQSAAAFLGYDTYIKGLDPDEGFIAQVKNYTVNKLAKLNEKIITTVVYTHTIMNINIVKANITLNNEMIAEAELRIFINK
ncbi:MAG: hypothetical protein R2777_09615 [Chitinophagales bacterium]|nr:hypothetical protein [Bacteroidota bacterium]MCB9225787.1 hypothetical protein [Chitinophagales bacterium]